jgi:hypothetical protein
VGVSESTLEHEKDSSSSSQNSPDPRGFSYIFVSAFSILVCWFLSKSRTTVLRSANHIHHQNSIDSTRERGQKISDGPIRVAVESFPPPESPPEERQREKQKKNLIKWAALFANILTLVAVAWYTLLTQKQLRVSSHSLQTTQEHFRIDERAWVGLEPVKPILRVPRSGKFGAGFDYEIYLRNTGKSVARCVEIRVPRQASQSSITMGDNAVTIDNTQNKFLLGEFKGSGDIPIIMSAPKALAPGQITTIPLSLFGQEPQIFTKDEWVSYFVGRVDYADEFGVQHWVKFCFFVADPKGNLWYCKYGNDEDNNPEVPPDKLPSCPVTAPPT